MKNTLIVLTGPTCSGKTTLGIEIAEQLKTSIISCDSRQFYREMKIGTAAPNDEQLQRVKHYFIGHKSVQDYYNVSLFEADVMNLLKSVFSEKQRVLMVGGSGLYIDAVCKGIDELPDMNPELRSSLTELYQKEGIESLRLNLKKLDPDYYASADLKNHQRIIRAIEVCLLSGKPYSSFRKKKPKPRPFNILKIALNSERQKLYERINARVDEMISQGLVEETKSLLPFRRLNSLKTVGYKEIFEYLDGTVSLEEAILLIKRNTRHYARKQISWFGKYKDINLFKPEDKKNLMALINP